MYGRAFYTLEYVPHVKTMKYKLIPSLSYQLLEEFQRDVDRIYQELLSDYFKPLERLGVNIEYYVIDEKRVCPLYFKGAIFEICRSDKINDCGI